MNVSDMQFRPLCLKPTGGDGWCGHVLMADGHGRWRCGAGHVWYGQNGNALKSTPWGEQPTVELGETRDRFDTVLAMVRLAAGPICFCCGWLVAWSVMRRRRS